VNYVHIKIDGTIQIIDMYCPSSNDT